jgi:hypothetical protein
MSATIFEITVSLDGFVAGPNATVENPLGEGGERLHEWIVAIPTGVRGTAFRPAKARPTRAAQTTTSTASRWRRRART